MKFCLGLLKYYKRDKWTGEAVYIIMTPLTNTAGRILIVGPQSITEEDTYFCPMIKEIPPNKIDKQIQEELDYNDNNQGTQFQVIEELDCTAKQINVLKTTTNNLFKIRFKQKGKYVRSDLNIILDSIESLKVGRKTYKVTGDIDLDIEPSKLGVMRMKLHKKLAFFKGMRRPFKNVK